MLSDDDIRVLRGALADGPTPGPLYIRTNRHPTTDCRPWGWLDTKPPGAGQGPIPGVQVTWERGSRSEANARYIAAASPDRVARLLDEVERLRMCADELKEVTAAADDPRINLTITLAEYTREVKDEIERLRAEVSAVALPPALRLPEPMTEDEISDRAREMVKGGKSVDWLARAIEDEVLRRVKEANE